MEEESVTSTLWMGDVSEMKLRQGVCFQMSLVFATTFASFLPFFNYSGVSYFRQECNFAN